MPLTLSGQTQLKLEQTLAQWRQWRCEPPLSGAPHIEARITAGLSNYCVLVGSESRQFVIRIDGVNPALNGLNRQAEWRTLQLAADAGLAPQPRYYNPDLGCLVCDYLPHDEQQTPQLPDVARLLRDIHALPARHHRLDFGERFLRYEKMVEKHDHPLGPALLSYRESIWATLEKLRECDNLSVLCHNDLNPANLLYSNGRLWALDWEYSAMGSPWFDIAVTALGLELSDAQTAELLHHYLQHPADTAQLNLVTRYAILGRYLELLWHLAQVNTGENAVPLTQKLDALARVVASHNE